MKRLFWLTIILLLGACGPSGKVYNGPFIAEDGIGQCALPCNDSSISGLVRQFHKNGQVKSEIYYVNGLRDGLFKIYGDDGQLDRSGHFKNGLHHGSFKTYVWGELSSKYTCHHGAWVRGSYVSYEMPSASGVFHITGFIPSNLCENIPY
jgi:hypothetical protein